MLARPAIGKRLLIDLCNQSSEEESESEDDLPKPSQFRPVFVPK